MLKKIFFQIHWFLGITAGLILSIMGVTGAIYSYDQQILKWMNTDSYTVQAENRAKLTPAELYQHFQQQDPDTKINSITIAKDPTASSTVNIVKEGERRGKNIMVNPYTAEMLPEIKGQAFFQFIQQLHRNLTVGPVGKQITGACALMLIFFVLSGLYLRWPKKHSAKQWLFVKPKLNGRNFIWDLHAVVGTWVIVFYLLMAMTGLYWSYDWWRNGMFKVLGVERPQAEMQAPPQGERGQRPERGENAQAGERPQQGEGMQRGERGAMNAEGDQRPARGENTQGERPQQAEDMQRGERGAMNAEGRPEGERGNKKESLSPAQISTALTQTWTGFNAQVGRDYSSMTFTLPKKDNGMMDISFVDAIPQHERARNSAKFNYQSSTIEEMKLYEEKKLNEKIMSSMLPAHRGSFFGPIYQFFAMLASLLMPLFFVTGWMLYLKRRKQKKLTLQARQGASATQVDPNATPWLIAYASQTGTAEQLAWRTATSLQTAHQPVTVKAVQELKADDLKNATQVLFIVSTYGTGEAPDLASAFEKKMLGSTLDLSHLNYAVLALGSKEYAESYCQFGHRLTAWLKQNQAHAFFNTIEVDNNNPEQIKMWDDALQNASKLELHSASLDKVFDTWTLQKRDLLNPNSLGAPAFNLELKPQHEVTWQAGDIAEIQPANSPERIARFMQQHQIATHTPVDSLNINIEHALWDRDLTQSVEPFANMEHLLEQLKPLPSREYSIASIPSQQILRLVVRQQSDAQGELGLGSGWLTQHAPVGSEIALRIRTNASFHLIDDNRPMICIGNGTGIAGLMSLLHARTRLNYTQNWLIFGERQREHDFFYQSTLEAWQTTGMLQYLDLAFSRDQADKIYVHHKLREQAQELKAWIENGAVIYVCGSIQGMASDVDQALQEILGEAQLDDLRQQGRYRRDVY